MKQSKKQFTARNTNPSPPTRNKTTNKDWKTHNLEILELAFNSSQDGAVIVTSEGYITHLNDAYGKFLGVDPEEFIGKHCTDVIDNSRLHIVAKTGKPEINFPQRIDNRDVVVQRFPFFSEGKVAGVYARIIFSDVNDIKNLVDKFSLLESKVQLYEKELINLRSTRYTIDSIIGVSTAILNLKKEALQATANNFPVLITGESGTGKELFAQAIHHASPRKMYPFVRLNCAAIPGDLLESELFGYDKGAFTGARSKGKPGKFELANRGSIFLDEIGELPLEMQPKLLRILEEKEFERVGGTRLIHSDFRLIAATNRNLEEMMAKGLFRRDLYYRLNVISLNIPPLRERRDDIIPLAHHLLGQVSEDVRLDKAIEKMFYFFEWKGNTRELLNVLEQSLSRVIGTVIRPEDLPFYLQHHEEPVECKSVSTFKQAQIRAEIEVIKKALTFTGYHKAKAARLLGIHRTLLYKKAATYGIPLKLKDQL